MAGGRQERQADHREDPQRRHPRGGGQDPHPHHGAGLWGAWVGAWSGLARAPRRRARRARWARLRWTTPVRGPRQAARGRPLAFTDELNAYRSRCILFILNAGCVGARLLPGRAEPPAGLHDHVRRQVRFSSKFCHRAASYGLFKPDMPAMQPIGAARDSGRRQASPTRPTPPPPHPGRRARHPPTRAPSGPPCHPARAGSSTGTRWPSASPPPPPEKVWGPCAAARQLSCRLNCSSGLGRAPRRCTAAPSLEAPHEQGPKRALPTMLTHGHAGWWSWKPPPSALPPLLLAQ